MSTKLVSFSSDVPSLDSLFSFSSVLNKAENFVTALPLIVTKL